MLISLSQARGQRTAERLKVSSTFSKVAGCGTASHGLGVARGAGLACRLGRRWTVPTGHQRPCLPLLPKRGTNVPLLGWHRARGFACGRAGWVPPRPLPGLSPAFSPAGSVSAERCPPGTSAPRRGVLRASGTRPGPTGAEAETPAKSLPQEAFSTLLRLPKATKAAGASPPHPYKPFEKGLSENFTFLSQPKRGLSN